MQDEHSQVAVQITGLFEPHAIALTGDGTWLTNQTLAAAVSPDDLGPWSTSVTYQAADAGSDGLVLGSVDFTTADAGSP